MGLEKISFTWYMRHISWIAITGFLAGIGIYYLQNLFLAPTQQKFVSLPANAKIMR